MNVIQLSTVSFFILFEILNNVKLSQSIFNLLFIHNQFTSRHTLNFANFIQIFLWAKLYCMYIDVWRWFSHGSLHSFIVCFTAFENKKKNEKVVRAAHLRGTKILCLHCENSHPLNNTTTKKPHLLESLFSLFYVCNLVDMCNE